MISICTRRLLPAIVVFVPEGDRRVRIDAGLADERRKGLQSLKGKEARLYTLDERSGLWPLPAIPDHYD
jgi:hypothetical protein